MDTDEVLEGRYGPLAPFSEYKRGEKIAYKKDDKIHSGTIIWVCLPREIGEHHIPTHYIVQRDDPGKSVPDTMARTYCKLTFYGVWQRPLPGAAIFTRKACVTTSCSYCIRQKKTARKEYPAVSLGNCLTTKAPEGERCHSVNPLLNAFIIAYKKHLTAWCRCFLLRLRRLLIFMESEAKQLSTKHDSRDVLDCLCCQQKRA